MQTMLNTGRCSIGLAALGCALTIAACGGADSTGTGTGTSGAGASAANATPVQLSKCMRAHGVPNFPDPTEGSGGEGLTIAATPGSSTLTIDGVSFSGPAFEAAQKACSKFFPGGNGTPSPASESVKLRALAFARCMRGHGVPDFPDPAFPSTGGVQLRLVAGVDPRSPSFQQASRACGRGKLRAGP
jgi:hypothetical protein